MTDTDIMTIDEISKILTTEGVPIVDRMRAIFYARKHTDPKIIDVLKSGLWHPSVLLRHEIAYIMGQLQYEVALPILINLCDDKNEHPMVRHEAGEAIAALGIPSDEAIECILRNINDEDLAVKHTMELAHQCLMNKKKRFDFKADSINRVPKPLQGFYIFTVKRQNNPTNCDFNNTIDPVTSVDYLEDTANVVELSDLLRDESVNLWNRYQAMFTLRNINTDASAKGLARSFKEKSSALLRHEIAFVLGQMQKPNVYKELIEKLEEEGEVSMVRHEVALALGSVGVEAFYLKQKEIFDEIVNTLIKYSTDKDLIVAESCLVGIENIESETGTVINKS